MSTKLEAAVLADVRAFAKQLGEPLDHMTDTDLITRLKRVFAQAEQDRRIDQLTRDYADWNRSQGLDLGSADEHLFDEDLTPEQREWLRGFCDRWADATAPRH